MRIRVGDNLIKELSSRQALPKGQLGPVPGLARIGASHLDDLQSILYRSLRTLRWVEGI